MRCLQIAYENPSDVHPEALVLDRATGHTSVGFLPHTNSTRSPYVSPHHYSILATLISKVQQYMELPQQNSVCTTCFRYVTRPGHRKLISVRLR
jgi:hypothetical protein